MKKLKRYVPFIKAGLHQSTIYRINWMFIIVGNIIGCFVSYYLWKSVFEASASPNFMGFSMNDMITYIFITFITKSIINSSGAADIGEEIKDGSIAMRLIKPLSYNATLIFQEVGEKIIKLVFVFFPMIVGLEVFKYVIFETSNFSICRLGIYICSMILAYGINAFFNISFGFTAFFFKNLWGSKMLKDCIVNFLSGSVMPLNFFSGFLEKFFTVLPFAYLNFVPVMIYMGKYTDEMMIRKMMMQLVWCVFFWALSKIIWIFATKHLCIQGG